ncbi:MAG: hypothetical protein IJO10_09620 [Clostridia bacterium]|nr:hypothetical protein [Clostridia bacterium]
MEKNVKKASGGIQISVKHGHAGKKKISGQEMFFVYRKPLAGRVVQKKPIGDDVDRKTPFVLR